MNVELPVSGNAASRSGNWLAERVMGRRGQCRTGEGFLSLVVPEPLFVRFEALDNWMASSAPVQRGMLRRRRIAAAHVSTLGAAPEVHPPASSDLTLGTACSAWRHCRVDASDHSRSLVNQRGSEAEALLHQDGGDAASCDHLVDDEDVVDAAGHSVGLPRAGILEGIAVLVDPPHPGCHIRDDLLAANDQ